MIVGNASVRDMSVAGVQRSARWSLCPSLMVRFPNVSLDKHRSCFLVDWFRSRSYAFHLGLRVDTWLTDKTLDYHATASWNSRVKKR